MKYYPVALNLNNKAVLVVGGGQVAEFKVLNLNKAGARIRVVSPTITPRINRLVHRGKVVWINRCVLKKDLHTMDLIISATNSNEVNEKVCRWAREKKIWINVVDNPPLCDFISPAIFNKGKSIVAVNSNGQDPVLSRDLKNFLKANWEEFLSYRRSLKNL